MKPEHPIEPAPLNTVPALPRWVTSGAADTAEELVFRSGAALAHLHSVLHLPDLPAALLRDRLAVAAAAQCNALSGRAERETELRDAVHLLRPGDLPGPAGQVALAWHRAVARPMSRKRMERALPGLDPVAISEWLAPNSGGAVTRAALVLEAVLADHPRNEDAALILADAALARALGWDHVVPLLGLGIPARAMRTRGDDLRLACHRALLQTVPTVLQEAAGVHRRAVRLRAVAPKLRAKGAERAVDLFLTRDAVAPTALTAFMSDRAARRLCDRLVALGVVRELTGRDSFRLYGV